MHVNLSIFLNNLNLLIASSPNIPPNAIAPQSPSPSFSFKTIKKPQRQNCIPLRSQKSASLSGNSSPKYADSRREARAESRPLGAAASRKSVGAIASDKCVQRPADASARFSSASPPAPSSHAARVRERSIARVTQSLRRGEN